MQRLRGVRSSSDRQALADRSMLTPAMILAVAFRTVSGSHIDRRARFILSALTGMSRGQRRAC